MPPILFSFSFPFFPVLGDNLCFCKMQAVKYLLDAKTFQKVKFVYPKDKNSVELMSTYFDVENLPTEFGGKATMNYDHEEFSRLMYQDDVKSANVWGFGEKLQHVVGNGHPATEVPPEPACLAPAS